MIKDYILKNYDVADIDFDTKRVQLGSGFNDKGETSIEQKNIIIYINNIKHTKNYGELIDIKRGVASSLEQLFGIDFRSYGSKWGLIFYQIKREEI